jgi:hypothetical protein
MRFHRYTNKANTYVPAFRTPFRVTIYWKRIRTTTETREYSGSVDHLREITASKGKHRTSAQPKLFEIQNYRSTDSDVQLYPGYLSIQLHVSQMAVANDARTRPGISISWPQSLTPDRGMVLHSRGESHQVITYLLES